MKTTDYVNYELAKKLKECGFEEPCDHYWCKVYTNSDEMGLRQSLAYDYNNDDWDIPHCSAPHIYHAQKWLREKKGIDVLVYNCACGYLWEVSKADEQSRGTALIPYDDNGEDEASGCWLSYEKAISAGIEAALKLI